MVRTKNAPVKNPSHIRVQKLITFPFKVLELVGKPLFLLLRSTIVLSILLANTTGRTISSFRSFIASKIRGDNVRRRIDKINWRIKIHPIHFTIPKVRIKRKKTNKSIIDIVKLFILKFRLYTLSLAKYIHRRTFKRHQKLYIAGLTIIMIPTVLVIGVWQLYLTDLPSIDTLATREIEVSTKIYDRNGQLLYKIYKDKNRTPLILEEIPQQVILATLAIEDENFYSHPGFSVKGIVRSLIDNYNDGTLSGGSTITQQLVKNTLLTSEKTLERKIKEFALALEVEHKFSKNDILEMYLNEVSYGGTAYGIQEASQYYFGKDAADLSIAESALLAGLPRSPSTNSPFGTNPESAKLRQKDVLRLMEENGYISAEQRSKSENEVLKFATNITNIDAPHFVMFVRDYLEDKYGKTLVEKGGLDVITSIDLSIQKVAEQAVDEELENLKRLNVGNAGVVVMDPKNGEILAMVGSRNYFDIASEGNVNTTISLRQPGSSIKVINYAYALEHGLTASSIIDDSPITYDIAGQKPYSPKNYDGKYRGKITLRSSLAESRNIPAVKTLEKYGVTSMLDEGKIMGITTWTEPERYGLSLTLGGAEVKLTDMAIVYSTLANYGKRPSISPIINIKNYKGITLYPQTEKRYLTDRLFGGEIQAQEKINYDQISIQAIDPKVAFIITDILKDNSARTPAFGSRSLLNVEGHPEVAVKTGTSNSLRDNLAIGYTNDYVVAVWVGNNDNTPMSRVASGVTGATPIFNKIMTSLLADKESTEWSAPEGMVQVDICPSTGTLACGGCSKKEWFIAGTEPKEKCSTQKAEDVKVKNLNDKQN